MATTFNQWEFKGPDGPRRIEVGGSFETNNAITLHHAAIAGIGLIRVGNFTVAQSIRDGHLVPVLGDFEAATESNVYAVYPHSRHLSRKVRAFVDMLVEAFSPVVPWERTGERTGERAGEDKSP